MQIFVDATGWRRTGVRLVSAALAGGLLAFVVLVVSTLLAQW
ncbi:hypothetical protein Lesp02_61050 [Lentzea sp. NBRC 105346]|nr:hypothetical protein [Lentzea sp. NBRC 105346]GLZ33917.1 hypothetical protein Lesp02_61050 [Lentzea sp. NBRC 105346]